MIINFIYIFTILVGIYYAITTYIHTKNKIVIFAMAILLMSLILELQRLNLGNFLIDTTDFFRTLRDIVRTVGMIVWFRYVYKLKK